MPAVIGIILLLMSLLLTSLGVVRERDIGTLDHLSVTPLTPMALMLGKTLPVAVVALIGLVTVTAVAVSTGTSPVCSSSMMSCMGRWMLRPLGVYHRPVVILRNSRPFSGYTVCTGPLPKVGWPSSSARS